MPTVSRRSFFQGAALAASASRVLGANDRINVGIVGLGGRGRNHMQDYSSLSTECRISALCDVNQEALERGEAMVLKATEQKPKGYRDMRELFADKNVDAVSLATPNHWHALATIWACEAGKDVYCEKPACHNVYEGRRMVETARRTKRMVQIGSQSRSTPHKIRAIEMLHEGAIGEIYLAKALCFKRRPSIGRTPEIDTPPGIDWDKFLGPAPMRRFSWNRFRYNWHWFWDTGNGDIGNQGVHEMDIARWGAKAAMPKWVFSSGGKYNFEDDQETPNYQLTTFGYDGLEIVFEVRGWLTGAEGNLAMKGQNFIGNLFYGSEGWMYLDAAGYQVYKGEKNEKVMDEKPVPAGDYKTAPHMTNFLQACRSRKHQDLTAEVEIGVLSADLCHLANISYRTGKRLEWDAAKQKFVNAPEADALLTRNYRKPYVV